jgi:hypothetical protein
VPAATLAAITTVSQKPGGENEQPVLKIVVNPFLQLRVLWGCPVILLTRVVHIKVNHHPQIEQIAQTIETVRQWFESV